MNGRRDFLKGSAIAVSALALGGVSTRVSASQGASFAGVIYTKDNPGTMAAKVKSHAPEVNVAGSKVSLKTVHPMSAEHHIVRHTLVLFDGTVVGGVTFQPTDKAESFFDLPAGYKGKVYATSFCNKHDFWLTEFSV
jgi:superoxide reductase